MTNQEMNDLLDESKEKLRKVIKEGGQMQVAGMFGDLLKEECISTITLSVMFVKIRSILNI